MFKQFLPILILLSIGFTVFAQTPEQVMAVKPTLQTRSPLACKGLASAGFTTRTKAVTAKTSDKHFLCLGDTLNVTNLGANLTEDPRPSTTAGIGYIFYDCPSSVSGPALSSIKADPCIKKTPFNGALPAQGLWLARGDSTGRVSFANNGQLQNGYNAGKPLKIFYAPVTVYDFRAATATISETSDTACVNVNTADGTANDPFSVVYLNAIKISNLKYGSLSGSFTVSGGLPEYNASNYTSFKITKNGNPAIIGTVTGTGTHGSTISFTVPENGSYTITAVDGVACDGLITATFPAITLKLSDEIVNVSGDTACVSLTTKNFTNVASFQFYITYNPAIIRYVGIKNINPALTGFNTASNVNFSQDTLNISWPNLVGVNIPDNASLFQICFKTIGPIGSVSPIKFFDPEVDLRTSVSDPSDTQFGLDTIRGSVKIGSLPVNVKLAAVDLNCNKDKTGKINIISTGAGAPYTFSWRGKTDPLLNGTGTMAVGDTGKITTLSAGFYYVTVTNVGNDIKIDSIEVKEPSPLLANAPFSINTCLGDSSGSLEIRAVAGGTPPYRYRWNNGETTAKISKLRAGSYSATITDAKGCTTSVSGDIIATPIKVTGKNVTAALCKDVKTGAITISGVSGGAPVGGNYTFTWSNNGLTGSGATFSNPNLGAGDYRVTISDGTCTGIDSFTVPAERTLELTATVTNVVCNSDPTGRIFVTASARGTSNPPYTFNWTGINAGDITKTPATTLAINLKAGRYPLSILDRDGCKLDSTFTITEPTAIKIDSVNLKNESCLAGSDGTITIFASGGTVNTSGFTYTYQWSRSPSDNTPTISNLKAGTYTVTVTDNVGCFKTRTFTITIPQKPTLALVTKDASCFGIADGSAKVIVTPPVGAVVTGFKWNNGGVIDMISPLKADTYRVTVTLSNGCLKDTFAVVKSPAPLMIDTAKSSKRDPTCPGYDDGQIILIMKGGTAPYVYTWSGGNPIGNPVFALLKAGAYNFKVEDFNKCPLFETTIALVAPPDISVGFTEIMGTKCFGVCNANKSNGKATAVASGGPANTGIYTYLWSSGETTARAIELCGGWQAITVSDGTCFKRDSVDVPQPLPFTFETPVIEEPSCFGLKDARTEVKISGGTPPYAYNWSNGVVTKDIINVAAGTYSVVVTDQNLCVASPLSIKINEPQLLKLDTLSSETNNVSCFGLNDGQIALKRLGGNGGNTTYKWSGNVNPANTNKTINLKAGIYYITATDRKGCRDSIKYTLQQPDKIYYFLEPPVAPRCYGELTFIKLDTAFGSTYLHPFTVSVDNGPQYPIGYQVPVFADEHLITITEQITGCSDTLSVKISQPPPIKIRFADIVDSIPIPHILVGLGTAVRLNPIITGALPIDSVSWTPKDYLRFAGEPLRPFVKPLDDKTYKLRVTDVNGCIGEAEILVELERNRNIYIPNVFSPNGDDKNDYFGSFAGVGVKSINYVRIFDRWGELLFQAQNLLPSGDPSSGWDGTFKGRAVDVGVYVYLIEVVFEDGAKLLYRGDITLAR